jgi:hypothetical protein
MMVLQYVMLTPILTRLHSNVQNVSVTMYLRLRRLWTITVSSRIFFLIFKNLETKCECAPGYYIDPSQNIDLFMPKCIKCLPGTYPTQDKLKCQPCGQATEDKTLQICKCPENTYL